ncbi:hypothetical protein, conserved [Eimeria brunetti]|uniref:Uncharacterized protein n=1 Tax=Eimeria brunetti TaxID=51314 RepID=U6LMK0_9EIME|nr:hypothetical protein, conserved [Eimeria brunetti]
MSDPPDTAARPPGSAPGAVASKDISTAAALASETAVALLSAAAETAAATMETEGHLPKTHKGPSDSTSKSLWNTDNDDNGHCETSPEQSQYGEQQNPSTIKSAGAPKYSSEQKNRASTTVEEEDDLPAFADEESIALHGQIRDKERLLARQGTELGQKAERVVLMKQHLQQLKAEADYLENLVAAKEAHINSDKHMEGVAVRQASKLKSEMQQQQQQQQQLYSRLTALQVDVAKGQEQMDCFKLRMKWNEEELAQWRSAAHQKEEDLACIAEFKRKDDVRAAGLMAQAQRASAEVTEAKKRLQEEQTAARAARAELQRSLEYFAEQQKDRALLIAQGKAQRTLAKVDEEDSRCANNVGDIRLACASLDRELQSIVKQKEKLVLAESLRKLEVTRLHEELEACADASLEAENRKVQHQLQVQEALAAMELELDGARGQLRAVEEERRKLVKEAAERRSKLSALEARYENVVQSSQTADGAGRSQAYYVIRVGQEREELQRKGAEMHRRLQSASVEVQGLEASLRDVSLSNSRLRSRLQQEIGVVGALHEERAEKEGALFLRNHMVFTQQQQICALKEAIEKEERCLKQTRQQHQCILNRLREVDEQKRNLQKESNYIDEKLQRSMKQRFRVQTSMQKRRACTAPSTQATEANEETKLCNAEIQCHAECLEGMLQSLYRSMGPTVASQPDAFESLQRALGEGKNTRRYIAIFGQAPC